jgi:hypothetical protein
MFKDFRGGRRLKAGEARNLVRAISSRFIQTGRWEDRKEIFNDARFGRRSGERYQNPRVRSESCLGRSRKALGARGDTHPGLGVNDVAPRTFCRRTNALACAEEMERINAVTTATSNASRTFLPLPSGVGQTSG